MSKLFVVPLSGGSDVEILFSAPKVQGPVGYALQDEIIERAADTLAGALDMMRHIGQCATERFAALATDAVEVKVGLNLNAKGKFVVAEASAAASLEVKFTIRGKAQTKPD